jgi:hypothetical protein
MCRIGLSKWFVEEVFMKILPERASDKAKETLKADEPSSAALTYKDMRLLYAAADTMGFHERYGGFKVIAKENNMLVVSSLL